MRPAHVLLAGLLLSGIVVEAPAAGTTAADFLKIAPGARPAGMGEAFVAVADETSGMFYNPAGPAFAFSPETQATYAMWLGDTYSGFLGYTHPTLSGTFGLGVQYLSAPAMEKFSDGAAQGSFSFADGAASLLYASRLNDTFSLGFDLKGVQSQIDASNVSTLTGDAGILYRTPEEGFSFGLAGQNLFGKLGEDDLPAIYRAGMAFKANLPDHYSDVLLSLEAGREGDGPNYYAAGLEHWGAGTLGLRVGYKYFDDQKLRDSLDVLAPWSAGISLRVASVALDYAFQPFAALGNTHRLTLTWRTFGWKTRRRMVPAQVKADPKIFSPNGDGGKDSVFFVPQVPDIRDVKDWELRIEDIGHTVVRRVTGRDMLPKILTWDGATDTKERVPEGKYLYTFIAEGDGRKRGQSSYGELIADMTPPAASLQSTTERFAPREDELGDKATFYISVSDAYGIDAWQLSIINGRGKTMKVFKSTESAPAELVWDGREDYYGIIVPNGVYEARLSAWDASGNRSRASTRITVDVPPQVREVVREVVKEVEVKQEKRGLVVNLSSQVLFGTGAAELKEEASRALDEVVSLLQTYPDNDVLIEGHTDSTGSRARNLELSSARAWAVYSYLVKKGVAPARLKPGGYGPDRPEASNRTPWGRTRNRRVEIIILKKDTLPGENPQDVPSSGEKQ